MSRNLILLLSIALLVLQSGCRNRCGNQCGSGGFFAGNSTIPAPPTYSLNIPSVAGSQPYYVPGSGNGAIGTLNPNAPPTFNPSQNQAQLNGWRPSDSNSGSNSNTNSNAPTTFANGSTVPPGFRTASATALPGSGSSFTDSRNYQSTRVDETLDRTRLAATDASSVRAPAQTNPTGAIPHLGSPQNDPRYANNPSGFYGAPQVGFAPVNNRGFIGQPQIGSPGYTGSPYTTTTAPAVLAQSTTTTDPRSSGQLGWRDREMGSDSFR